MPSPIASTSEPCRPLQSSTQPTDPSLLPSNAANLSLELSASSSIPASINLTDISNLAPNAPAPTCAKVVNEHTKVTRGKNGIFKPKVLLTEYVEQEPPNVK